METQELLSTVPATPTAAENVASALQRIAHKKMVLLLMTTIYLAKAGAHPFYLIANSLIGTAAILWADYFEQRSKQTPDSEVNNH